MNYCEDIKEKMLLAEPKKICCSKSLICGILAGAEMMPSASDVKTKKDPEQVITFRTEQKSLAELAQRLLHLRFGREPELLEGSRPGHKIYLLSFSSKPLETYLLGLEAEEGDPFAFRCPECKAAFLRGLFLGAGSLTDPSVSFHLEFRVPPERADRLVSLLEGTGEKPRVCTRRDKVGIYYKKSASIGDFFSEIGENSLYFEILNHQIERQIRASENRATNCVMRNIEKTVSASLVQVAAVKELFYTGEIERLPQELRETALLRLEYDNDSLSVLAGRHVPPITKSGLTHRLRRIVEIADGLKAAAEAEKQAKA